MNHRAFFILLHLGFSGACYLSNASPETFACKMTDLGKEYRGKINVTRSGKDCQRWNLGDPILRSPVVKNCSIMYPKYLQENYCRNPDDEPRGPWCYTTTIDRNWESCTVPYCDSTTEQETLLKTNTLESTTFPTSLVTTSTATSDFPTLKEEQNQSGIADVTTNTPTTRECYCPCSKVKKKWSHLENLTFAELKEALKDDLQKLEKELSVDKKNLSAAIRRLRQILESRLLMLVY